MNRIFCDKCDKEITNNEYVNQSIFVSYDNEGCIDYDYCKNCWEKTQ